MISLRHFEESDAEVLQTYNLSGKSNDDIISMVHDWSTLSYKGRYFEMFAIQKDVTIVGSISIYERSNSIASLGIEIFAPYRRTGHAYEAMRLLIEFATQKAIRLSCNKFELTIWPAYACMKSSALKRMAMSTKIKKGIRF